MALNITPGMSAQEFYDQLNSSNIFTNPFRGWSDSSKEAFFNYLNAEQANLHEIDMWHMNNEYNTPANQIQRMIDAGINPAAAYDKVSSGVAGSAPGTHKADSTHFTDRAQQLQMAQMALSQFNEMIKLTNDTVTNMYQLPEQMSRNKIAEYNESAAQMEWQALNSLHEQHAIIMEDSPEWKNLNQDMRDLYTPYGDGMMVMKSVLHDPYSQKYLKDMIDLYQKKDTRVWLQNYRKHLSAMFQDEERQLEYNAEMRRYMQEYKKTLPPKVRYAFDMLENLFSIASPFVQNYQRKKLGFIK